MKVILTGGTGMVGGILLELCLKSSKVDEVVSFVRKPSNASKNPKLKEVVLSDFEDYSNQHSEFENVSMAFFCIGVYTGKVADDLFKKITVDYAVAFASALEKQSPHSTFCLLSGQGADRTEKSRTSFARYKGMAENRIAKLKLRFHTFRPGYIYPTVSRNEPNLLYRMMRFSYPLIKLLGKNMSVKSTELALAMFNVGLHGAEKEILENKDILKEI